ncbi:MAG: hypothetical protein ACK5NQ_19295 [Pseudomonas sp.]|nr:hypothetical protein [Stutzerimonas nitrititolerans]
MESKIPLPTDNLYKFFALFALVLFISGFGTVILATKITNELAFEHWVEVETLQAVEKPTVNQAARLKSLQKKLEIAVSDKQTYTYVGLALIAIGTAGIWLGFERWLLRIQPLADQMAATQLEIARLQLLSLKADLQAKGIDVDKA